MKVDRLTPATTSKTNTNTLIFFIFILTTYPIVFTREKIITLIAIPFDIALSFHLDHTEIVLSTSPGFGKENSIVYFVLFFGFLLSWYNHYFCSRFDTKNKKASNRGTSINPIMFIFIFGVLNFHGWITTLAPQKYIGVLPIYIQHLHPIGVSSKDSPW